MSRRAAQASSAPRPASFDAGRSAFRPPADACIPREVSTGSSTFVSSPDFDYNKRPARPQNAAAQTGSASARHGNHAGVRQFAALGTPSSSLPRRRRLPNAPYTRSASVAAMYGNSQLQKYSLGSCSSEEDMFTTTECTSCDDFGETESIMSEQNYRSQNYATWKESALESIEYHRRSPCLVTWQRSSDRSHLEGHMILKKNIATHELIASGVTNPNGLGLKVVGGRMTDSGALGAFVTMVTPGGISDMIGRLRVGDQILEWNGQSLQSLTLDEVFQIILDSKDDVQVEIVALRALDTSRERRSETLGRHTKSAARANIYRSQPSSRQRLPESRTQTLFETIRDELPRKQHSEAPCPVHDAERTGRIQTRLWLDDENGYLIVTVICALLVHSAAGSCYCSVRLIPQRGQVTNRRSKSVSGARDLRWNQTFVFPAASVGVTDSATLELCVCDDQTARAIAQTQIQLSDVLLGDEPGWHTLFRTPCRRVDNTLSDDAVYSDDERRPLPSTKHSRTQNVPPEVESSEYESDVQRDAPRRFKNSSLPTEEPNNVDIYERYQQLIEQSKRDRHVYSPASRNRRHSHGSSTRYQRDNHVASDASESGVSESPQPSVQSVERSRRPTTLAMRPLSDVSEDAHSKEDSLRASDASSQRTGKSRRQTAQNEPDGTLRQNSSRMTRKPYARSVSAESPDVQDEANVVAPDQDAVTVKDGNASDSGVATGSATSGNGNNAAADSQKTATATATATANDQSVSDSAKTNSTTTASNSQSKLANDTDSGTKRKPTEPTTPKKSTTKIGNRSASSSNLQEKKGQFQRSEEVGRAALLRASGASKPDLSDTGGFIDGLGLGQIVGRQALGATCLGEIQLSLLDRKSALEVEVIRCRNLAVPKNVAKVLPACYVKLYLMDKKQCLEKQRTNVSQKRTLEPVYQQKITFTEVYKERTLQVMIWGDYARTDRKVFMGVAQINLAALDLRKCTLCWYKLYPANSIVGGVAE